MQSEGKVLVIDNGLELASTVRDAARFSTWEYITASEQKEAMMKVLAERPEVIVLGYMEPRGTSFKVHILLKENDDTADIPQVVVDVAPEEQAARGWRKNEGILMDAEEYLCQPLTPEELGEVIERTLARVKVTDVI